MKLTKLTQGRQMGKKAMQEAVIRFLFSLDEAKNKMLEQRALNKLAPKAPKNKYNLTTEQIEQMVDMTPKEKKAFLRGLS